MSEDAIFGMFFITFTVIVLVTSAFIAYFLWDTVSRIPKEYRTIEPYFAWLTLIPLAGFVFLWIIIPFKIPESLKAYFSAKEKSDFNKGDFGRKYGLGVTISSTLMLVPGLNMLAWLPALVFLILYLVTLNEFKQHLPTRNQNFIDTQKNTVSSKLSSQATTPNTTIKYEQLVQLKKLLDDGILTQDEFETEKRKLLET